MNREEKAEAPWSPGSLVSGSSSQCQKGKPGSAVVMHTLNTQLNLHPFPCVLRMLQVSLCGYFLWALFYVYMLHKTADHGGSTS